MNNISNKRRARIKRIKKYISCVRFIKKNFFMGICLCGLFISGIAFFVIFLGRWQDRKELESQQNYLSGQRLQERIDADDLFENALFRYADKDMAAAEELPAKMLLQYQSLYEENNDLIGWLSIEGTVINYPVMQTPEDEEYYLYRDFYGNENSNGCLIMDTDSVVGVGTRAHDYTYSVTSADAGEPNDICRESVNTTRPSTNLIIHGHTMRSGDMFGDLELYEEEEYGKEHNRICFDSLYEHREYELIAVFRSQVYRVQDDVFKYYQFFQADTQEEFDDWYDNIKSLSVYDTGVTAVFGDEFITLSSCAYHTENGRFVVVGRRIG